MMTRKRRRKKTKRIKKTRKIKNKMTMSTRIRIEVAVILTSRCLNLAWTLAEMERPSPKIMTMKKIRKTKSQRRTKIMLINQRRDTLD